MAHGVRISDVLSAIEQYVNGWDQTSHVQLSKDINQGRCLTAGH